VGSLDGTPTQGTDELHLIFAVQQTLYVYLITESGPEPGRSCSSAKTKMVANAQHTCLFNFVMIFHLLTVFVLVLFLNSLLSIYQKALPTKM
jgi:hypothetical protein